MNEVKLYQMSVYKTKIIVLYALNNESFQIVFVIFITKQITLILKNAQHFTYNKKFPV